MQTFSFRNTSLSTNNKVKYKWDIGELTNMKILKRPEYRLFLMEDKSSGLTKMMVQLALLMKIEQPARIKTAENGAIPAKNWSWS